MVLEALNRGLHVFSEKSMATSLDEARRVAVAVRRAGRVYQMGIASGSQRSPRRQTVARGVAALSVHVAAGAANAARGR